MNETLDPIIQEYAARLDHVTRQARAFNDALNAIQEVLNDPSHGAYHSDLWAMVQTVLDTGKR